MLAPPATTGDGAGGAAAAEDFRAAAEAAAGRGAALPSRDGVDAVEFTTGRLLGSNDQNLWMSLGEAA